MINIKQIVGLKRKIVPFILDAGDILESKPRIYYFILKFILNWLGKSVNSLETRLDGCRSILKISNGVWDNAS